MTRFTPRLLWVALSLGASSAALAGSLPAAGTRLEVPIVKQAPERCGQAALEMVLRYYGADARALREGDRAYDPALRGSLITDLAAAARRAGFEADIATLAPDSLIALLADGVPPVVLFQNGPPPLTVPHFGVVTGWDAARGRFTLNDGGARPRVVRRNELDKRWRTAGYQALIVRRRGP
jgi:ABC-type bacteriocin/lantibiotic exporter with double-glycine peptidase domain